MRKHQRRNTYNEERKGASNTRKAQSSTRQPQPVSPELQALLDWGGKMTKMRQHGERVEDWMHTHYSELLKAHTATLK